MPFPPSWAELAGAAVARRGPKDKEGGTRQSRLNPNVRAFKPSFCAGCTGDTTPSSSAVIILPITTKYAGAHAHQVLHEFSVNGVAR